MSYSIEQIETVISGVFLQKNTSSDKIEHLLVDSRKLLFPATTLFFALSGPRRNGEQFVKELFDRGVRNFVVQNEILKDPDNYPGANIIAVKDVLEALQHLAIHHRNNFTIPVIGITGSNGKTIVKEWLNQLLQADNNIVRSPKSYNSQIGVPLSVWQMNTGNTLAIFEAGISQVGEMQKLEKIIQPTAGIFTSIGQAHNEGFSNMKQKVIEKCKLFKHCRVLFYQKEILESYINIKTDKENIHGRTACGCWFGIRPA